MASPRSASARVLAALIYDDGADMWKIRAPYEPGWIDEFKRLVPHGARRWLKDEKLWLCDPMFLDITKDLCDKYFGDGSDASGYRESRPSFAPPPQVAPEATCYRAFIELLPPDILKRTFRDACRALHPDAIGGDGKAMSALNVAWDAIKKVHSL